MDLVGEFYGLTLDTPTMILPLLLSTFVDCVQQLGGTARVRRADCGTEMLQRCKGEMVKMIERGMTVHHVWKISF